MKKFTALLKRLHLQQVLTVFLLSLLLLTNPNFSANPTNSLIATNPESRILYPGAETPAGRVEKEKELPLITDKNFQETKAGNRIQNEPDLGTRVQERLETVKEQIEEATGFIQDKASEASDRPELQKNPAVGR